MRYGRPQESVGRRMTGWLWACIILLLAVALLGLWTVANAGQFHQISIRFKTYGELKQRTEWLINSCDTISMTIEKHGDTTIYKDYLPPKVICKRFLQSEIVKDVKISEHYLVLIIDMRSNSSSQSPRCDTIPGEAIISYEEER